MHDYTHLWDDRNETCRQINIFEKYTKCISQSEMCIKGHNKAAMGLYM